MTTQVACVVVLTVLASSTISAQSDRERIQGHLKDGQKVSITDTQGREITGRIGTVTTATVSVLDHGKTMTVPYDEILRIDRPRDGLANGALIGLSVGAALALVSIAAEDQSDCPPGGFFPCGEPTTGYYVAGALVLGGLGTAVGIAIDALIHHNRQIYQRGAQVRTTISPAIGPASFGTSVSVLW